MHQRLGELLTNTEYSAKTPAGISEIPGVQGQDSGLSSVVRQATEEIKQLQTATQGSTSSLLATAEALSQGTTSRAASSEGILGSVKEAAGGLLGGGLGSLFPIFAGIASLFGGGQSEPPPLVEYQAPEKQNFNLAIQNGMAGDAVYSGDGQVRSSSFTELALKGLTAGSGVARPDSTSAGETQAATKSAPQITVQVQAMDSRSFLDHSHDIAMAVRDAMLNMHSLNDVVNDL